MTYSFNPKHKPAEKVKPGEVVLLKVEDGFGGQIKDGKSVSDLDWSKIDGATGPLFIETARAGDTLVVEILEVKTARRGTIVTIPKYGVLASRSFRATAKAVSIGGGFVHFERNVRVRVEPMIGTIGVCPKSGNTPTGTLGNHGGNMDTKAVRAGTKLYFPVFVDGALFAAGDMHAVQADGELCVSAIEVAGEILLRFGVVKGKMPKWPILETNDSFSLLACGDSLDEAAENAAEEAVHALMREYDWPFEKAYMLGSLVIDLQINQVVDPKKGARATISKDFASLNSFLT